MPSHDDLPDLYTRAGFLLKRCHQISAAIFVDECREFAMTPSGYGALRVLRSHPGIDQVALGRLTGLDRSTTGLVVRLCLARNLIERAVNPGDRRRKVLRLTPAGVTMLEEIAPAVGRAQERVLEVLPRSERPRFLGLLAQFLDGHGATIREDEVVRASLTVLKRAAAEPRRSRVTRGAKVRRA